MNRIAAAKLAATGAAALLVAISPNVSGVAVPNGCPAGLPGAALVFIPAGATPYCIDAREVKQKQYAEFLAAAKLQPPAQIPECALNDRFEPIPVAGDGPQVAGSCRAGVFDPATRGDYSVTCVDWCDARAYCEWAGKRLCGGLGGAPETLERQTDPALSEWQFACTNGGLFSYPYGAQYVGGKCVDRNVARERIAGSRGTPECKGALPPFDQLYDLAGSIMEWTSACDSQFCSLQGGYYGDAQGSCGSVGVSTRGAVLPGAGFRCCADAIEVQK